MERIKGKILVVDDEKSVRDVCKLNLTGRGFMVETSQSAEEALNLFVNTRFDLVLTDVKMPGLTGIELLRRLKDIDNGVPVVVMTGYGDIKEAVETMKAGASHYVLKPLTMDELTVIIENTLKEKRLKEELDILRTDVEYRYKFKNIVTKSKKIEQILELVRVVAKTSAFILIEGATGTGKELIAHAIHYESARAKNPFIKINCAAIPESLLESELFGYEKGAFSGAVRRHIGKFEQANNGTLLLDEIGELSPLIQVKILRVIENGEFYRLGGTELISSDVRIISSTNKDLYEEVKAGRFREDLYYRINTFNIKIPPLKDRKEDIPPLVDHFLSLYSKKYNKKVKSISEEALFKLMDYDWPGNVRELEHVIERGVVLCKGNTLESVTIPLGEEKKKIMTMKETLLEAEKRAINLALKEANGIQARAARLLGLSRSNLSYRMRKLGIKSSKDSGNIEKTLE